MTRGRLSWSVTAARWWYHIIASSSFDETGDGAVLFDHLGGQLFPGFVKLKRHPLILFWSVSNIGQVFQYSGRP